MLYAIRDRRAGIQPAGPEGLVGRPLSENQTPKFKKDARLGISIDPSDCDDTAAPQKVLMSSSTNRAWGDPTTFGMLELE